MSNNYVIGVDPASGTDKTAICLVEILPDGRAKVLYSGLFVTLVDQ